MPLHSEFLSGYSAEWDGPQVLTDQSADWAGTLVLTGHTSDWEGKEVVVKLQWYNSPSYFFQMFTFGRT